MGGRLECRRDLRREGGKLTKRIASRVLHDKYVYQVLETDWRSIRRLTRCTNRGLGNLDCRSWVRVDDVEEHVRSGVHRTRNDRRERIARADQEQTESESKTLANITVESMSIAMSITR